MKNKMTTEEVYETLCAAQGFLISIIESDTDKSIKEDLQDLKDPMSLLLDIQLDVLTELKKVKDDYVPYFMED